MNQWKTKLAIYFERSHCTALITIVAPLKYDSVAIMKYLTSHIGIFQGFSWQIMKYHEQHKCKINYGEIQGYGYTSLKLSKLLSRMHLVTNCLRYLMPATAALQSNDVGIVLPSACQFDQNIRCQVHIATRNFRKIVT